LEKSEEKPNKELLIGLKTTTSKKNQLLDLLQELQPHLKEEWDMQAL
jgi:hypothetical protein